MPEWVADELTVRQLAKELAIYFASVAEGCGPSFYAYEA